MKLISMTDFVLEQIKESTGLEKVGGVGIALSRIHKYANFLKKPLTLGMFVPCDEEGNVLENPIETIGGVELYTEIYQQAKERVLFKGFEMYKGNPYNHYKARAVVKDYIEEGWTIEKIIHWDLDLTKIAIKQLGL